ncbi:RNA methyltransferase [Paenimyroides tangerinum]|uniref:RNA methyltransferase n=1 Tax=Paenimyroides tangerinum TaxID=2488728 RepID=A0A3P3W7V3_9FLAO|nr:RNA methyltransferase [Paenimyroides tangerinum]RRJ91245.1 RNA methyltransferase [Paenimyroides tangerinum]
MKQISSLQNPIIKNLVQLQEKSKARKTSETFLIEGRREVSLALIGNFRIKTILFCIEYISVEEIHELIKNSNEIELIEISKDVYQKLAYRDTTEGLIAVAQNKSTKLADLQLKDNPLILIAEAPEKPGNIGALLRTADAANIDAVIIANPKSDLYNPNVIRSSVGCVFTNQIAMATSEEVISFLKDRNISIYSAILQEAKPYYTQNFKEATAIVVGTEATGLSEIWRKESNQNIIIPMEGAIDSMNVSVAAAILLFEAKRQRDYSS